MQQLIVYLSVVSFCLLIGCNDKITNPAGIDYLSKKNSKSSSELTQEEIDGIILDRQAEKLARDVYFTLNDNWQLEFLSKIILSEQKHMDATKRLLIKFGIEDPITDDAVGAFSNPKFSLLFTDFVNRGLISKIETFNVGAEIEEANIQFFEDQLSLVSAKSIVRVYTNLQKASERHLATFLKHSEKEPSIPEVN